MSPTLPTGTTAGRLAAYTTNEAIFVYDIVEDAATPLGAPGARATGIMPRFRAADQVWFAAERRPSDNEHPFGQDSLYEVAGQHEPIESLRLPNIVVGHDWDPNGERLAYTIRGDSGSGNQPAQLCVYDAVQATVSLISRLGYPDGTGAGQREETFVRWSPNGDMLLVVDTAQRPSLMILDLTGQAVIEPRDGTFARWLDHEKVLYQEDPSGDSGDWRVLSTVTGNTQILGMPRGAHRPAISPDGTLIAYDDGSPTPSVFSFDVASGSSQLIASDHAGPLWLDEQWVAMTTAGPCSSGLDCTFPWKPLGETLAANLDSGDQRPLSLPSTLQDAYRREAIDLWIGEL